MTGHLITTPIKASIHARCGTPVLTGHAEGLHARVDLTPLTRTGEIHALIAGLQTYTLTREGLIHRDASRIGDPRLRHRPVLAEHRCHRLIPANQQAATLCATAPEPTEGIPY